MITFDSLNFQEFSLLEHHVFLVSLDTHTYTHRHRHACTHTHTQTDAHIYTMMS